MNVQNWKKNWALFLFNFKYNFKGLYSALQAEVYEKGSQHHPNWSSLFLLNTEAGSSVPWMRNTSVFYSLLWQIKTTLA